MEHVAQPSSHSTPVRKLDQNFFGQKKDTPFFRPLIQPKLTIGPVNDPYEKEADAMADAVMRMPAPDVSQVTSAPAGIQKKCAACEEEEEHVQRKEAPVRPATDAPVQRKCSACEEKEKKQSVQLKPAPGKAVQRQCSECEKEDAVQRKATAHSTLPDVSPSVYSTLQSGGSPMDRSTRSFMEARFGYDFGLVRIHNDAASHQSTADINALAYTHGHHVAFAAGQYQPGSATGRKLLAHELTHVIQQNGKAQQKNSGGIGQHSHHEATKPTWEATKQVGDRTPSTSSHDAKPAAVVVQKKCAACDEEVHRKEASVPSTIPALHHASITTTTLGSEATALKQGKVVATGTGNGNVCGAGAPADANRKNGTGSNALVPRPMIRTVVEREDKKVRRESAPIQVPSTDNVKEWESPIGKAFLWKNVDLRKIIYPQREDSLRAFLEIVKSFEEKGLLPSDANAQGDDLVKILESDRSILQQQLDDAKAEKETLHGEVQTGKEEITRLQGEQKDAEKNLRNLLKPGTDAQAVTNAKVKIERLMKTLLNTIETSQQNLDYLALTKNSISEKAYNDKKSLFENRKNAAIEKRAKLSDELKPVMDKYEELVGPLELAKAIVIEQLNDRKDYNKKTDARLKVVNASIKQLDADLKRIMKVVGAVKKLGPGGMTGTQKNELSQWRMSHYRGLLKTMDHDALLHEVVDVFKKHAASGFFPPWMQYAVTHFSGMRYATAHGTWEKNPKALLLLLKDLELNAASNEEVLQRMGETTNDLNKADTAKLEALWLGLRKKVGNKNADMADQVKALAKQLRTQYMALSKLEKSTDDFGKVMEEIKKLEESIEALHTSFSPDNWKAVLKTRADERQLLIGLFRTKARNKINALNTKQALGLLKEMHDKKQIPDFAWKEIATFTELRVGISETDLVSKENKALKKVPVPPGQEEDFARWKGILEAWYKTNDPTAWREEQRKTLSVSIVTSLVCDQISSILQHGRGLAPAGGLRKNAMFYYNQARLLPKDKAAPWDMKTVCPPPPSKPVFKRPGRLEDFSCGASIFWMKWSDLEITKPYAAFYEKNEAPVLKKIKELIDKRKKLLKSDPKKELAAVEKELFELNVKRKKMLEDRAKLSMFESQENRKNKAPFIPDNSNVVSSFPEDDLKLFDTETTYKEQKGNTQTTIADYQEESFEIKNGLVRNGWTYSINSDRIVNETKQKKGPPKKTFMESIMRVKPNPNAGVCPNGEKDCPLNFDNKPSAKLIKQWLVWQHQATVLFVRAPDTVITFDTSGTFDGKQIRGLSAHEWSLKSLTGTKNVFVGFAPGNDMNMSYFLNDENLFGSDAAPAPDPAVQDPSKTYSDKKDGE